MILKKWFIKAKWLDPTPVREGDPPRESQWVRVGYATEQHTGGGISCKFFAMPMPGWDGSFALFPQDPKEPS